MIPFFIIGLFMLMYLIEEGFSYLYTLSSDLSGWNNIYEFTQISSVVLIIIFGILSSFFFMNYEFTKKEKELRKALNLRTIFWIILIILLLSNYLDIFYF